jgi:SAM-dependent methyltransferase
VAGDDRARSLSDFDALLAEAASTPVDGWDFSRFGDRLRALPRPWDFARIVSDEASRSATMLDLGTGGGEWLAALETRAPRTVATESWPPNVPVARERLAPLGIDVVETAGAPDNVAQAGELPSLPFADASFELVCSRHESYVAAEVARVLVPGGVFLTQQTGGDYGDFHELLGRERPVVAEPAWTRAFAAAQLEAAGFVVEDGAESFEEIQFADVGALAWYLRAIPWVVPGFTIAGYREALRELSARSPFVARQPTFWLRAHRVSH